MDLLLAAVGPRKKLLRSELICKLHLLCFLVINVQDLVR